MSWTGVSAAHQTKDDPLASLSVFGIKVGETLVVSSNSLPRFIGLITFTIIFVLENKVTEQTENDDNNKSTADIIVSTNEITKERAPTSSVLGHMLMEVEVEQKRKKIDEKENNEKEWVPPNMS